MNFNISDPLTAADLEKDRRQNNGTVWQQPAEACTELGAEVESMLRHRRVAETVRWIVAFTLGVVIAVVMVSLAHAEVIGVDFLYG